MKRFDAAIIGAGPDGLIAAITLARAGLDVVVLEKNAVAGGRAETREFHPGFRASAFADELPAIPSYLLRSLALARNGAILAPAEASLCISDDGPHLLFADPVRAARSAPAVARDGLIAIVREIRQAREAIAARAAAPAASRPPLWFEFWQKHETPEPWPAGEWGNVSLDEKLHAHISDPALCLHLAADAVVGRAVSPFLIGSAQHLLAPGTGRSGMAAGGMGALAQALAAIAQSAGVTVRCAAEVTDIVVRQGRAVGLALAGGEEVQARAFLSTLDVKRTFLSLVAWKELPKETLKRVGQYRMAGASARVLMALDAMPVAPASQAMFGPIHIVGNMGSLLRAHEFWHAGVLPEAPLVTLRIPSGVDPRLAPVGKAVMTATLSAIPARLFDGPWSDLKRERLKQIALEAAERAFPGVSERVLAAQTVIASDIEAALGATAGDLDGGEIAPDQLLGFRPLQDWPDGRTCLPRLYLGGASSSPAPFFCGASAERAARTLIADLRREAGEP